jgi:hypothetical protein
MGEDTGITMRSSCKDLNAEFQIRSPSDLRKAIAITRDNLAETYHGRCGWWKPIVGIT